MKVNMQYPDESIHDIIPNNLVNVGNKIYVLGYYDETLSSNMQTILIKENNSFFKQPLKKYGVSWKLFLEYSKKKGKQEDVNILPQIINCKNPVSDHSFISSHFLLSLKGIVDFKPEAVPTDAILVFHNLFDEKYYWDESCNNLIEGGLKSLAGYNYEIKDVYVKTRKEPSNFQTATRTVTTIYFNEEDKKYYYDEKCTMEIPGGLKNLGNIDYQIKKVKIRKEEKSTKDHVVFDKEKQIRKKDRKEIIVYKNDNDGLYITPSDAKNIFGHVNSVFIIDSDSKTNYSYSKLSDDDLEFLEEEYDINYQPLRKKEDGKFTEKTKDNSENERRRELQKQLEELNRLRNKIENELSVMGYDNSYDSVRGHGK